MSTFDPHLQAGKDIHIEERNHVEVTHIDGLNDKGELVRVRLTQSTAANPAFDVTPARLVSAYITENGIMKAAQELAA